MIRRVTVPNLGRIARHILRNQKPPKAIIRVAQIGGVSGQHMETPSMLLREPLTCSRMVKCGPFVLFRYSPLGLSRSVIPVIGVVLINIARCNHVLEDRCAHNSGLCSGPYHPTYDSRWANYDCAGKEIHLVMALAEAPWHSSLRVF